MSTVVRLAILVLLATAAARGTAGEPTKAQAPSGWVRVEALELGYQASSPVPKGYVLLVPARAAAEPVDSSTAEQRYAHQLDDLGQAVVAVDAPATYVVALVAAPDVVESIEGGNEPTAVTLVVDWHPSPLVLKATRVEVQPGETVTVRITVRTPKPNIPPEMVPTPPSLGNAGLLASADETAADHPEGPPSPGRTAERTTTRTLGAAGLALGLTGLLLAVAGWLQHARRRTRPRN